MSYQMYIKKCFKRKEKMLIGIAILIINAIILVKLPFSLNNLLEGLLNISHTGWIVLMKGLSFFTFLQISSFSLQYISGRVFKSIGNSISEELCLEVFEKLYYCIETEPPQTDVGNIVVVMDRDCFQIGENGILILYEIALLLINVFSLVYFMLTTDIVLTIIITLVFTGLLLIQRSLNKKMERFIHEGRKISAEYTNDIQLLGNNYSEYRRTNSFSYVFDGFRYKLSNLLAKRYDASEIVYRSTLINGIGTAINSIIVMCIGSMLFLNGTIQVSRLITFNSYSSIFGSYLTQIPSLIMKVKMFNLSYNRVIELLSLRSYNYDEVLGCGKIEEGKIVTLKVNNVSIGYKNNEVISNFTEVFKIGHVTSLKGENGSGKSTLMKFLAKEELVSEGNVKIELNNLSMLREIEFSDFTYVSADPILFEGSIIENIILGNIERKDAAIDLFTRLGFDDWVNDLEDGFNTIINQFNPNISSGQKQKISIIRALLQDTSVLLLDEIEKHLDKKSKESIMNYLKEICNDKVVVLATHDSDLIERSDRVITFVNGGLA